MVKKRAARLHEDSEISSHDSWSDEEPDFLSRPECQRTLDKFVDDGFDPNKAPPALNWKITSLLK
jgi:hypothetical protein